MVQCLLFSCEMWTLYRKHVRQLERFHVRSLRSLMGIKWQDRVTDLEVLDRVGLVSIEAMIIKAHLCWTGHLICMDSSRIPCRSFIGYLHRDTETPGGQRNTTNAASRKT